MSKLDVLELRADAVLLKELTELPAWHVFVKYANRAMEGAIDRGFRPQTGPRMTQYFKGVYAGVHDLLQIPEYVRRQVESAREDTRIG